MIKKREAQRDEVIGEGGHGGRGQYYNRIYPGSLIHILSVYRRVKYTHIISERTYFISADDFYLTWFPNS